jgi:hypothetical protein
MNKQLIDEKVEEQPAEPWGELWPKDEYRSPDERTETTSDQMLWPRDEYRPQDERAGHVIERLLFPRDELRPPDERAGHQIERHLWTQYQGS